MPFRVESPDSAAIASGLGFVATGAIAAAVALQPFGESAACWLRSVEIGFLRACRPFGSILNRQFSEVAFGQVCR